jgi:hypothetical protein
MTKVHEDPRSPSERVDDLPRILEAMGQGVREALLRHKRAGNPIAVWRDGAVVWIPPEEIEVNDTPSASTQSRA